MNMKNMENRVIPPFQLTPHFHVNEFACKDGSAVPSHLLSNVRALAVNLEIIRAYFGVAVIVNSGYRTVAYNRKVGGAVGSQHLLANAADIVVQGVSPFFLFKTIRELMKRGAIEAGAVILYNTFVHYDRRGSMLFLDYRNKSKS